MRWCCCVKWVSSLFGVSVQAKVASCIIGFVQTCDFFLLIAGEKGLFSALICWRCLSKIYGLSPK